MKWAKKGFIYKPDHVADWWHSTAMAPAAFMRGDVIRILIGGWDAEGISRIGYVDVDADDPKKVLGISLRPLLDIGNPGCFDDNGVFPGHVYSHNGKQYLYYTGFQKLHKIPFSNFSGLAISEDGGETFTRVSQAPVMDRADEGLFTRAGTSVIYEDGVFKACYSVGSAWRFINGKDRPVYNVNYIESPDGITFPNKGTAIVSCDDMFEHGLGRPQLIKIDDVYCVFYTRRMIDYRYKMGMAISRDCRSWTRKDEYLDSIELGAEGEFDSEMVYFPCVIDTGRQVYLLYCGNGYGRTGIGYAQLER